MHISPTVKAVVSSDVIENGKPIMFAKYDIENDCWIFTGTDDNCEPILVSMQKVFDIDNSIEELSDMPLRSFAIKDKDTLKWKILK